TIDGGHMTVLRTEIGAPVSPATTPAEAHAFVGVGFGSSNGQLDVINGGVLTIGNASSGLQTNSTFGAGLNIGGSGGNTPPSGAGSGLVSGAGSKVETLGLGGFVNVGRNNTTNPGNLSTLTVNDGGRIDTTFLGVGRGGA